MAGMRGADNPNVLSAERKALIQRCLDDGWSWHQIQLTHGVTWGTMKRYFDGTQWSRRGGAKLGAAVRHAQRAAFPQVKRRISAG